MLGVKFPIAGLLCLGLMSLLGGCGGGGGGGFTGSENALSVVIKTSDGSSDVGWNPTLLGLNANQSYTKAITAEVFDSQGHLYPAAQLEISLLNPDHGVLCAPAPSSSSGGSSSADALNPPPSCTSSTGTGVSGPFSRVQYQNQSSVQFFFVANNSPGTVQIVVKAQDLVPSGSSSSSGTSSSGTSSSSSGTSSGGGGIQGRQVSNTLTLNVIGNVAPVASLKLTGPYVNAVVARQLTAGIAPGDAKLADGSYQRVISVVASDANGNPPQVGTPIQFFMIDGPIHGFPNNPGSFTIAGNDGDPLEGGYDFFAKDGQFRAKGVVPGDQLVLDGVDFSQPNNRQLTGIRMVGSVIADSELSIDSGGLAFNTNAAGDTGPTVPYIIGHPESANILASSTTDDSGVASTLLTYPASQIGKTALIVACTTDRKVCTVLNTCDATGQNCGSVFLPVSNGTNIVLTVAPTDLGPNTNTPVTFCLKDPNFTPLQATPISYNINSFLGASSVAINGNSALSGSLTTGGDGCVTAIVSSSGQAPGSKAIPIDFSADGVPKPVTVTIEGPGAGKLRADTTCDMSDVFAFNDANSIYQQCLKTNSTDTSQCGPAPKAPASVACTVALTLTDDAGGPISGVEVTDSVTGPGLLNISYKPPFSPTSGMTDAAGRVSVDVVFQTTAQTTLTFTAGAATIAVTSPFVAPATQ